MNLTAVSLPFSIPAPVLALGAHTKNRICFAVGSTAFLTPSHGDLSFSDSYARFEKAARSLLQKKPRLIACDLHPDYASSRLARGWSKGRSVSSGLPSGVTVTGIQHHHAHVAACLAENGIGGGRAIGVAFDGTGLGSDGSLWGAEFFVVEGGRWQRRAHLMEVPLLGGAQAIRQPWRVLAAWSCGMPGWIPYGITVKERAAAVQLLRSGAAWPSASSMGRLFDAVGVMVLGAKEAQHEGALAMRLEEISGCVEARTGPAYPFRITVSKGVFVIDPRPLFKAVADACRGGASRPQVARRFHATVAKMLVDVCSRLQGPSGIRRVALSGGVFQNRLLFALAQKSLTDKGFTVVSHRALPCSDESIALGQALLAGEQLRRRVRRRSDVSRDPDARQAHRR